MKQEIASLWAKGLVLAALGTGLTSCQSIRSFNVSLRIRMFQGKLDMDGFMEPCAKLSFVGADSVVCRTYELPAWDICPPPGTLRVDGHYEPCPPPGWFSARDDFDDPSESITNGQSRAHLEAYRFFGLPLEIDPGEGYVEYDLEVRATSLHRAHLVRDRILEQVHLGPTGFRERIPGVYEVHHLLHGQLVGREVLFTLFDTHALEEFDLILNGVAGYRDIDDLAQLHRNDWHMASVGVDLADLDWGIIPGVEYTNQYQLEVKRVGSNPELLAGEWVYTP